MGGGFRGDCSGAALVRILGERFRSAVLVSGFCGRRFW